MASVVLRRASPAARDVATGTVHRLAIASMSREPLWHEALILGRDGALMDHVSPKTHRKKHRKKLSTYATATHAAAATAPVTPATVAGDRLSRNAALASLCSPTSAMNRAYPIAANPHTSVAKTQRSTRRKKPFYASASRVVSRRF